MTNDQLEIFKLKARVLMLEHLLLDVAIQSLAALHRTTGRQSQQALVAELRATVKGLEKNLRKTFPEAAEYALHSDEVKEIADDLADLILSFDTGSASGPAE